MMDQSVFFLGKSADLPLFGSDASILYTAAGLCSRLVASHNHVTAREVLYETAYPSKECPVSSCCCYASGDHRDGLLPVSFGNEGRYRSVICRSGRDCGSGSCPGGCICTGHQRLHVPDRSGQPDEKGS